MTRLFLMLLVGVVVLGFVGCGTTDENPEQARLEALTAKYRSEQQDQVDRLASRYFWGKWHNTVSDDFARHNWIEYPYAAMMWGFSFISTGHQRRDFDDMHRGIDRYIFNAAWDDPTLAR